MQTAPDQSKIEKASQKKQVVGGGITPFSRDPLSGMQQ